MAGSDPGMGFDRDGGEPVVRELRHFRLVLVDNRGSGLSDLPAGRFASPTWLVASSPCSTTQVFGQPHYGREPRWHDGPGTGVDYPDRVDGLVLVSTTPR